MDKNKILKSPLLIRSALKLNDEKFINEQGIYHRSFLTTLKHTYLRKYFTATKYYIRLGSMRRIIQILGKLPILAFISIKNYVLLQELLHQRTGKYWSMEEFIDYIIKWVIYNYTLPEVEPKVPLFKTNHMRYYYLGLFAEKFEKELRIERKSKGKVQIKRG